MWFLSCVAPQGRSRQLVCGNVCVPQIAYGSRAGDTPGLRGGVGHDSTGSGGVAQSSGVSRTGRIGLRTPITHSYAINEFSYALVIARAYDLYKLRFIGVRVPLSKDGLQRPGEMDFPALWGLFRH